MLLSSLAFQGVRRVAPLSICRVSTAQMKRRREAPAPQSLGHAGQQKVSLPGGGADPDGVEATAILT
jgi:hypothetical protein